MAKKKKHYNSVNISSDIVQIMSNQSGQSEEGTNTSSQSANTTGVDTDLLRSIDTTLKSILQQGATMSQSDARNSMPGKRYTDTGYSNDEKWGKGNKYNGDKYKGFLKEFEEGIREQLLEGLFGTDIKGTIQKTLSTFEDEFNISLTDIPKGLGKEAVKWLGEEFKKTDTGKQMNAKLSQVKEKGGAYIKSTFTKGVEEYDAKNGTNYASRMSSVFDKSQQSAKDQPASKQAEAVKNSAQSENVALDQIELLTAIANNVEILAQAKHNQIQNAIYREGKDKGLTGDDLNKYVTDQLAESTWNDVSKLGDLLQKKGQGAATAEKVAGSGGEVLKGLAEGENLKGIFGALGQGAKSLAGGLVKNLGPQLMKLGPQAALVGLALLAVSNALGNFKMMLDATKEYLKELGKAANRQSEARKKNLEAQQQRLEADVKTMVEEPFNILKEAAESLYSAWDNNIRTINGTQGYSKDDLYDLISNYATRLRSEGLTDVVSSADITTNLTKVLESGLSGQVAEEFAYLATKLNAAIPTQDFFSYAETYASLAANAIKDGKSQTEAISYANSQLEEFASNVLYASRNLAGGFSSGLKDAESLFKSSVEIATAAKTNNISEISGVLTSVSAIVGAIAPDLSNSIVDAVVNAAVGGNSSEVVALRSLAGINASNTEFLKALTSDPQSVFEELFSNLGSMQTMSSDAYMEVAEGVSEIFGLSKEALQRVDFNYLADQISKMNVNNMSLSENLSLLASGESTTTAEQLKMAQINQYMIDEGLEYVLDNEAARAIQQHMWDEQLAREITESMFAVELQGSSATFLEKIVSGVENIIGFLNPLKWLQKGLNLAQTAQEGAAQRADIAQFLELGKVGQSSAKTLYNLTTYGKDLNLTDSLVNLMGGFSAYQMINDTGKVRNNILTGLTGGAVYSIGQSATSTNQLYLGVLDGIVNSLTSSNSATNIGASRYTWGTLGKSISKAITSSPNNSLLTLSSTYTTETSQSTANTNKRFQDFLNTVEDAATSGMSYDQWAATASKYGIKDLEAAVEDYGTTTTALEQYFTDNQAAAYTAQQAEREKTEEEFWKNGNTFWLEYHPAFRDQLYIYQQALIDNQLLQIELATESNKLANNIYGKEKEFYNQWVDYYVNHTAYSKETLKAYDVAAIRNAEKSEAGDAVLALAKALTSNAVDLKDPAVQTNALLSQILIVAEAIMQQNNQTGGVLPTALSALGLGVVNK